MHCTGELVLCLGDIMDIYESIFMSVMMLFGRLSLPI